MNMWFYNKVQDSKKYVLAFFKKWHWKYPRKNWNIIENIKVIHLART